ncbi:MAG: heme ABC transporter substrate-binding protein IsdE [Eubacteriales bacterium]|nr:heme ABC transporter substrate-binding protein IsdE [Eubacteriales bacterium]
MDTKKIVGMLASMVLILGLLCGCVNQHPQQTGTESEVQDIGKINEGRIAKEEQGERIISGSVALCEIFDRLEIELTGVPMTKLGQMPQRYANTPMIGMPMNPDMEIIVSLQPTIIYAPDSLSDWLKSGYEKSGMKHSFVDLRSVDGLYRTIHMLATTYAKTEQEASLLEEKRDFEEQLADELAGKEKKKVLILMGLPGSYVAATPNSYVGSLVQMAGGENVVQAEEQEEFRQINTEALLQMDPDVILRTAHAMPEQVQEMFRKEFAENDIWKHFRAVEEQQVYDLPPDSCGMSARFNYRDGVTAIVQSLYPQGEK